MIYVCYQTRWTPSNSFVNILFCLYHTASQMKQPLVESRIWNRTRFECSLQNRNLEARKFCLKLIVVYLVTDQRTLAAFCWIPCHFTISTDIVCVPLSQFLLSVHIFSYFYKKNKIIITYIIVLFYKRFTVPNQSKHNRDCLKFGILNIIQAVRKLILKTLTLFSPKITVYLDINYLWIFLTFTIDSSIGF